MMMVLYLIQKIIIRTYTDMQRRGKIMEEIFIDLHDAYANSASGQKGCMICLTGIKNGVKTCLYGKFLKTGKN